jgi:hypothetical protein
MTTVKKKVVRSDKALIERGKPTSFWDSLFVNEEEESSVKNWRYASLFFSALPTSVMDVAFALAMHGIAYKYDGKGPSVLYNTFAGMHVARQQYLWAGLPLIQDYKDRNMSEDTQTAHKAAFAAGFAFGLWQNNRSNYKKLGPSII